jgi:DNA-binding NtrC family response regulator
VEVLVEHFLKRLAKREKRDKVLTPRALERLVGHEWPGNVRELENEMERLWVLSGDDVIIDEDLLSPSIGRRRLVAKPSVQPATPVVAAATVSAGVAPGVGASAVAPSGVNGAHTAGVNGNTAAPDAFSLDPGVSMPDAVERLERRMIGDELRKARGNKTKAADALGISRRNLIRKVQAYGLDEVGRRRGES